VKDIGLGYDSDWRPFHEQEDEYVTYDPNLIWRPKENCEIFNAQGCKGPELEIVKGVNEYIILTIGDSNTMGPSHTPGWPGYLRRMFRKEYPNIRIINAGLMGYTSWQGLKRFEELLKYEPDMVLISFGSNDALRVTISDKEYIESKKFFSSTIFQLRICKLLIAVNDILLMKDRRANQFIPRVSPKEYKDNLNKIITLSKEKNIKVILLTRPFIKFTDEEYDDLWWIHFCPQYNELTTNIARETNVAVIDVYSYFKDANEYFADEAHFNERGYKVAAQLIYGYITDLL